MPTASAPTASGFTVPIVQNGTRAYVAVEMGNIQPAQMLIDTGCTSMSVSEAIANDLLAHGEADALPDHQVQFADGSEHAVRQLAHPSNPHRRAHSQRCSGGRDAQWCRYAAGLPGAQPVGPVHR